MSGKCDICGKSTVFGRNIRHRHAGSWERKAPRTNRVFRPNVHKQVVHLDGKSVRLNVCTRCLRTQSRVSV
jgi:large subunit ribosomal protein L28